MTTEELIKILKAKADEEWNDIKEMRECANNRERRWAIVMNYINDIDKLVKDEEDKMSGVPLA